MASKATALAETTTMDTVDTPGGVFTSGWTEFDSLSTAFNATGRSLAFHHVIFAHNLWTNNSTSGISRNGADVTTGASDLVVALGSWPTPAEPPSNRQVRSTMNSGTTWGCCTADATPSIESQTI